MKHHDLKPRHCPCGGTITPHKGEERSKFEGRKYCCNICPVLRAAKKTYRHVKKPLGPVKYTGVDLYLMGRL